MRQSIPSLCEDYVGFVSDTLTLLKVCSLRLLLLLCGLAKIRKCKGAGGEASSVSQTYHPLRQGPNDGYTIAIPACTRKSFLGVLTEKWGQPSEEKV